MADKRFTRLAKMNVAKKSNEFPIRSRYTSFIDTINTRGDEYPSDAHLDAFDHISTFRDPNELDKMRSFFKVKELYKLVPAGPADRACHWKKDALFVFRDTLRADSDPFSLENLLCTETDSLHFDDLEAIDDLNHLIDSDNLVDNGSEPLIGLIPMQSDQVVSSLFDKEKDFFPASDYLERLTNEELDLYNVRKEAVDWIYKAYAHFCFGAPTICLAINYLDRYLSVYQVPDEKSWSFQLLAVACLLLAAKLEDVRVPSTANLQVAYPSLIFEAQSLKLMELKVLANLKWRMQACTPFSFIDFFIRKIKSEDTIPSGSLMYGSLIYRSCQFIVNTMKGLDFLEFRPSEISAAVAICVTRETQETQIDIAMSGIMHFERDRLLKCVQMIEDLTEIAESTDLPDGTLSAARAAPRSPDGVLDAAFLSYRIDSRTVVSDPSSSNAANQDPKRRRLD
ncbi:cyclin-D4-1-like [Apium graveolens]|uniref:cyclin-D4-1-like n=1 Tax=Apium graveolens TaxID=4045 RepID=UPI003D78D06F